LLSVALSPGGAGYVDVRQITGLELPDTRLDAYEAVVLSDVGGIDDASAGRLATFVEGGGTLLVWLGSDVSVGNYAASLLPRGLLPGTLVRQIAADAATDNDIGLVAFDFDPNQTHPFLEAFAGVDQTGLEAPLFRRYWQIEPAETSDVVLQFAGTMDPAVLVHRLGEGQVVTIATSADDPAWTLLPLLDNFPAFVHELFRNAVGAAGGGTAWQERIAGERLVVPPSVQLPPGVVPQLLGGATPIRLERRLAEGPPTWVSPPLAEVGSFELVAGDVRLPVVVNFPSVESDLIPADDGTLRTIFGDDVVLLDAAETSSDVLASSDDASDWGWMLLMLGLTLAAGEVAYAAFLGRRRG
ncbi:MAG: hypothetical protein AAF561_09015, partial [Planctomycetota bacterium]